MPMKTNGDTTLSDGDGAKFSRQLAPSSAARQQAAGGESSQSSGTAGRYCRAAGGVAVATPRPWDKALTLPIMTFLPIKTTLPIMTYCIRL